MHIVHDSNKVGRDSAARCSTPTAALQWALLLAGCESGWSIHLGDYRPPDRIRLPCICLGRYGPRPAIRTSMRHRMVSLRRIGAKPGVRAGASMTVGWHAVFDRARCVGTGMRFVERATLGSAAARSSVRAAHSVSVARDQRTCLRIDTVIGHAFGGAKASAWAWAHWSKVRGSRPVTSCTVGKTWDSSRVPSTKKLQNAST